MKLYSSLRDIPLELTNRLENSNEIHLSPAYLLSLEDASMPDFQQYVAAFYQEDKLIGFSLYQMVNMESDLPTGYMSIIPAWKLLFTRSQTAEDAVYARVLVGGDVFGTGVNLFRFNEDIPDADQWQLINHAGNEICTQEKQRVDFWLIKDFTGTNAPVSAVREAGLTQVFSEPVMTLSLRSDWSSFEDYLGAMKTKYRTKAKAAFKRSAKLELKEWTLRDLEANANTAIFLYDQIWRKSNFRPGKINAQTLINWKKNFGEDCRVQAYYLDGEIVGMQLGLLKQNILDAILVCFNVELNKQYSILETMLLEFVRWGIEDEMTEVRFGRTAGELKSTVGAVPTPAFGMVKHSRSALNHIVKWVGPLMKPKSFPVRSPFKDS